MHFIEILLQRYKENSLVVQLKARFLLFVYIILFFIIIIIIAYTSYLQLNNPAFGYSVDINLLGLASGMLILLIIFTVILVRGYFTMAAHGTLISLFIAIWIVMIVDRSEVVARIDTIVLLLAVISSIPFFITRSRIAVLIYTGVNLAAFYAFMFYFRNELNLSTSVFPEFIADNTIAFLFIGIVSYNLFFINNQAFEKMENSNLRLARSNEELQAANEEYEAQNVELIRSKNEIRESGEALRESEEKYRLIAENTADLISIMDMNLKFTYISHTIMRLRGFTVEEAMGQTMEQVLTPESLQLVRIVFDEEMLLEAGGMADPDRSRILELQENKKDGSTIWVEVNFTFLRDKDRKPSGILMVTRDITERKKAELRFSSMIQSLSDMILIMDINNRFSYESPSVSINMGYQPGFFIGKSPLDYIHPDDLQTAAKDLGGVFQAVNDGIATEFRFRKSDGTWAFLEAIGSNQLENPGIKGIILTVRDVSERKKAVEALRESEEQYRFISENTADVIWAIDLKTGKIIYISPSVYKLRGFTPEEVMNQSLQDIFPPESLEIVSSKIQNGINKEKGDPSLYNYVIQVDQLCKDGSSVPTEISSSLVFDGTDQPVKIIGISRDITGRLKAEEEKRVLEKQLFQADKMESIGKLAGGIAHDFNNLLMGIQGYASLSLMNLDSSHPNYEMLKMIQDQVQSGADLTRQLLGFARGGRYEIKPTDMNKTIEKTSAMFGRAKKEISIHLKKDEKLWSVEVDRSQMEQVFVNLFVNAWQAMPGGGNIYLETENIILSDVQAQSNSVSPGKFVKITVRDSGTGMDEKTMARIFDPFFTTKELGRGTGLGLATVKGIINGHKGIINVESEPGRGTAFTIYLPASEKEVAAEKSEKMEIIRGTETILLVDDEKMVLGVNKKILEFIGYKVFTAGSGQDAISVFKEKKSGIDLVIMDMIMPGISGTDLIDQIRDVRSDIRILLTSGYSISGEAQKIIDHGCSGFLQKPFQIEQLSRKIRDILG